MKTLTNEQLTELVHALFEEVVTIYVMSAFEAGDGPDSIVDLLHDLHERFAPLGLSVEAVEGATT